MKVLLQNKEDKRFYGMVGRWVEEADDALDFKDADHARLFARMERIQNAEVVIQEARPNHITRLSASALAPWTRLETQANPPKS